MASAKGARNAAMWATNWLQDQEKRTLGELDTGFNNAVAGFDQARGRFEPYQTAYAGAPGALADAYGLNGAEGQQRTLASLQNFNPAYSFLQQQGEQGVLRNAAARGRLAGGQTSTDLMSFNQGLAMDKVYQPYLQGLGGIADRGQQVAGSLAGLDTAQGALSYDLGQRRANLMDTNARDIAGLGIGALKAGDQAKAQNQAMIGSVLQGGLAMLGQFAGGGMGGMGGLGQMGSLFGGGGGGAGQFAGNGGLFNMQTMPQRYGV